MWSDVFTEKQAALISKLKHGQLKRINILEGSVRSGKTWVSLIVWALWITSMPADGGYLMTAKTLTALKRNCLDPLQDMVGKVNFSFSTTTKEGRLFGRKIYLEGANDAKAESKIRGLTLSGAYCDELTQVPEDYFAMLLSRLSAPGAKLIGTTNPDTPMHWLMQNYINRADQLDMLVETFLIDDNTFLDPEYVRQLKAEYQGVFYKRFILGQWCIADGLVYAFDEALSVVDKPPESRNGYRYFISVDYGTQNPCSMGLWAFDSDTGVACRAAEYYYSGRSNRAQKTDEEYYTELERLAGDRYIERVVVDPSAASFIETIRRHGRFSVRKAANDVLPGIRTVASLLQRGRLKICRECRDAIREFGLYSWDDKATEDRVVKDNDHAMDDIRYFAMTILRRELRWEEW